MFYILFSTFSVGAGAFSITFQPETPIAALDSQFFEWKRNSASDPPGAFNIELNNSNKTTIFDITNSTEMNGTSPLVFDQPGKYQLIALVVQADGSDGAAFFTTEVTVLPGPTSIALSTTSGSISSKVTVTSTSKISPSILPAGFHHKATSTRSKQAIGPIVGVVIGAVAFLGICIAFFVFYRRLRRRRSVIATLETPASPFRETTSSTEGLPFLRGCTKPTLPASMNPVVDTQTGGRKIRQIPLLTTSQPRETKEAPQDTTSNSEHTVRDDRDESSGETRDNAQNMENQPVTSNPMVMYRHQDSGWRVPVELKNNRDQTAADTVIEVIELPPDYSEV